MQAFLGASIRRFDAWLSRRYGIFTISDEAGCILRVQLAHAARTIQLPDQEIQVGEPVLLIHLWNEHIPPLPPNGPDLAWATNIQRLFIRSLQMVARQMVSDTRLSRAKAVCGTTVLLSPNEHPAGMHLMERLGFIVVPSRNRLGCFGEFWENFYAWWLMWAFNPASLRHRHFNNLCRVEIWISARNFKGRFGLNGAKKEPEKDYDHEYAYG
jgi:hypothetical protein